MRRVLCVCIVLMMVLGLMGCAGDAQQGNPASTVKHSDRVSASDYRAMLVQMLEELAPEKMDYFDSKVRPLDVPIIRGDAVRMAYYAAVCIGADDYNGYNFSSDLADSDGRAAEASDFIEQICPDVFQDNPVTMSGQTWDNEFTASFLWNIWHVDVVSGKQVFAFDEERKSMRMYDPLTMEEAECSIQRLRTGYGIKNYVPIDSPEAVDAGFSEAVLKKTAARQAESLEDLPRLTGFVLQNDGYFTTNPVSKTPEDIQRIAGWGFNTARMRLTYETLFNEDCSQIDLTQVRKLDELVAAAIEEDIHLDILLSTLPGWTKTLNLTEGSSESEIDLFLNPERQAEAARAWATLAARYQDVSGAHLSFTPFWEADGDLGVNSAQGWQHTQRDILDTLVVLIEAIREEDPERFLFYEPAADIDAQRTIAQSSIFYEPLKKKFDNLMISHNFCQNAYVFAEGTATEGEDIDMNNYSMFKPEYPVTIYGVGDTIPSGGALTVDGFLPAGTVIDLYLAETTGKAALTVMGDEVQLYREDLGEADYEVGRKLSSFYPYATSSKKVTVTLVDHAEKVTVSARGGSIRWSGMDIILPEAYAVERWYMNGGFDNYHEEFEPFLWIPTSAVMISPSENARAQRITVHEDVTFTTEEISAQANARTIDQWCAAISGFSPQCVVRYEDAFFSLGTTQASMLRYYEDVLSAFQAYGFSWLSNDYEVILETSSARIADPSLVEYDGYPRVNLELLELLQKYQEKSE